jgi:hypothetical protein
MKTFLSFNLLLGLILGGKVRAFSKQHLSIKFGITSMRPFLTSRAAPTPLFMNSETTESDAEHSSTPSEPPSPPSPSSPPKERRRLDPLIESLTRMSEETKSAPRTSVPLWGELILDKSLIVLLPVAAVAILGLVTSIYVAANSGDAFVEAIEKTNEAMMSKSAPIIIDESQCRGLCSSQQDDLENMRFFLNSIAGKKD